MPFPTPHLPFTLAEREALIAQRDALLGALQDFVDNDDTPERNCSCHLSPPCQDCVDFGGRREMLSNARNVIAKAEGSAR